MVNVYVPIIITIRKITKIICIKKYFFRANAVLCAVHKLAVITKNNQK